MEFELEPPYGIGVLRLGMTVAEARSALGSLGNLDDGSELYAHRPGGLGFNVGFGVAGRVNSVVVYRPDALDVVRYRDIDVFGLPALDVVERLRQHTNVIADEDEAGCFTAPELLLAFWRPFAADDDPAEEQGYYFNSVLVARPGYYDTPAEEAERLAAGGTPGY